MAIANRKHECFGFFFFFSFFFKELLNDTSLPHWLSDDWLLFAPPESTDLTVTGIAVITDMRFSPCSNQKPVLYILPSMTELFAGEHWPFFSSPFRNSIPQIFFSQQENSGISGEKSAQWTHFRISLPLSKMQGRRHLVSSLALCVLATKALLLSLWCVGEEARESGIIFLIL